MRNIKAKLLSVVIITITLFGCDNDQNEDVNSTPEFQSLDLDISSLPGAEFIFTGTVSDPAGISSINFKYEPWFLDKTIIKDSLPNLYEISYKFKVPESAMVNSVHTIPVTVSNIGNVQFTQNVIITLNKDIVSPDIQILNPVDGATVLIGSGNEIDFNIVVNDRELAEFKIESSILNETIAISGNTYTYTNSLDIANPDSYTFKITSTDASGNVTTKNLVVNVLDQLSFNQMFITDVTDDSLLSSDLFGIPYATSASTATSEDGFVFTGKFYSKQANSEVRFLAQKTSFSPYTFGADSNASGGLALGNSADINPIVLPTQGYYEIKMDLRDSSYTVTPYTPSDTAFNEVYIIGRGIYLDDTISTCTNNNTGGTTCWNWASGKPFNKDSANNYLWTIDVTLKDQPNDEGENGFILNANPAGWSPFWRVQDGDPSKTIPNGGTNFIFPDSALDKDYTFTFDTHLNRLSATIK